jgi:hypothetical protein
MKKRAKRSRKSTQPRPEPQYGERIIERGGLQLTWKDGKAVWKYLPVRSVIRKASKAEADEFMRQVREGVGLAVIKGSRRKRA